MLPSKLQDILCPSSALGLERVVQGHSTSAAGEVGTGHTGLPVVEGHSSRADLLAGTTWLLCGGLKKRLSRERVTLD